MRWGGGRLFQYCICEIAFLGMELGFFEAEVKQFYLPKYLLVGMGMNWENTVWFMDRDMRGL